MFRKKVQQTITQANTSLQFRTAPSSSDIAAWNAAMAQSMIKDFNEFRIDWLRYSYRCVSNGLLHGTNGVYPTFYAVYIGNSCGMNPTQFTTNQLINAENVKRVNFTPDMPQTSLFFRPTFPSDSTGVEEGHKTGIAAVDNAWRLSNNFGTSTIKSLNEYFGTIDSLAGETFEIMLEAKVSWRGRTNNWMNSPV